MLFLFLHLIAVCVACSRNLLDELCSLLILYVVYILFCFKFFPKYCADYFCLPRSPLFANLSDFIASAMCYNYLAQVSYAFDCNFGTHLGVKFLGIFGVYSF